MSEEPKNSKNLELAIGLIILISLIACALVYMDMQQRDSSREQAFSNMRSFSSGLFAFESDYGSFPNEETAIEVTRDFPSHGYNLRGKSSNAAFRQLLASGIIQSDIPFYAKIVGSIEPDGNIGSGEALKKGEVGFSYISGLSTIGNPNTPLVLTPLIPGTTKFDPKPFRGKAIIMYIDLSLRIYEISDDGHIYDKGIDILSSKHPVWKGKTPDIWYPE